MNIIGHQVTLRAMELSDLPQIHRWANDPEVQGGLGGWHFPLSMIGLEAWIKTFKHDSTDQRFIIDAANSGPIGIVTLTQINWKDRNALHGIILGEREHRRKGYATDAVRTIMTYAFTELGLERLDTTIVEFNAASIALHVNRCGWLIEGRKERAVFRRGRFWANIILGATKEADSWTSSLLSADDRPHAV